jgi:serine/threonine protein kinase
MDMPEPDLGPTTLPRGTKVGAWSVRGIRGRGSYGTVYRAVSQEHEHAGSVALKLAVNPGDTRFGREVELLSRIRHPSVPRLLDSGVWRPPWGGEHPFIIMEWVEGEPLYTWAARRNPSSRQVLVLLAQAAGALQATHEVNSVHRDVKGDNMLVRPSDGRLFLTDFGAGFFSGAARLTPPYFLPGTPEYRSPELWESTRYTGTQATSSALARPADDVFALGVTAYRLVTDTYPPLPLPDMKACQCWLPGGSGPPPPRQLNPRVDAQLNALILRMLSLNPEDRGSARELAEAMERGVAHAGPSADEPLFEWETLRPTQWTEEELAEAEYLGHRPRRRDREWVLRFAQAEAERAQPSVTRPTRKVRARSWLTWLAAAMALGLWAEETGSVHFMPHVTEARRSLEKERDPSSLGDAELSSPVEHAQDPVRNAVAEEFSKTPVPGQLKPDAKGRCPDKQIAFNGGCWTKVALSPEECRGNGAMYQGSCYIPFFESARRPTSAPQKR